MRPNQNRIVSAHKENLRAGIRCRKLLSEVKIIAQEIRMEMLEEKEKLLLNRSKKIKNPG